MVGVFATIATRGGDMAKRKWFERMCEEDISWVDDLQELMRGESPERFALLEHFGSSLCEFLDHIDALKLKCESPIEVKFLDALLQIAPCHGLPIAYRSEDLAQLFYGREITYDLYICPQYELTLQKKYRTDFYLITKERHKSGNRAVIVECDGHEFHERTKEQARRDKARDRDMAANGYTVMRFTGSEIHADAKECADQVASFLTRYRA